MSTATSAPPSPFMTCREVIAYTRLSRSALIRAEEAGRLVPLRPSCRKLLYRRSDVEAFLNCTPPPEGRRQQGA